MVNELKHSKISVFLCLYPYKNATHVFKDTADLSMQMHFIIDSLEQVLLVNYSCSSMGTASLLLHLRASLIGV